MVIIKEWFTVAEAAEYSRLSKRTIYTLTREGGLPAFRIGQEGHRRFCKEYLDIIPQLTDAERTTEALLQPNSKSDPVLVELWDNTRDAAYDRI